MCRNNIICCVVARISYQIKYDSCVTIARGIGAKDALTHSKLSIYTTLYGSTASSVHISNARRRSGRVECAYLKAR